MSRVKATWSLKKSVYIYIALFDRRLTVFLVASFRESEGQKLQVVGQIGTVAKGSILAAFLQHPSTSSSSISKPSSMAHGLPLPGGHALDRPVAILTTNGHPLNSGNTYPQEHSFRALQIHLESNSDGFVDKPSSPVSENSDQDSSMMAFINSVSTLNLPVIYH